MSLVAALSLLLSFWLIDAGRARADTERVRIQWTTDSDIDLQVFDSVGGRAYFGNRTAISSGLLSPDVVPALGDTSTHTEYYTDGPGDTPLGFCLHYFSGHGSSSPPTPVTYTITDPNGTTRSGSLALATLGDAALVGASPPGSKAGFFISPGDPVHCGTHTYIPSIGGWRFGNVTRPNIPYERMLQYYPDSADQMVSKQFTFFGPDVQSVLGRVFYNTLFEPTFAAGLCYGFSSASMAVFYGNQSDPRFINPNRSFQTIDASYPFGGSVGDLIERYHATQLGLASASVEAAAYAEQRSLDTQGVANKNAFDQLSAVLQNGPQLVVIAPTNVGDALTGTGHAVVAYRLGAQNGTPVIYVYDPNTPTDDDSRIEILANGGMRLVDGAGNVSLGQGGSSKDWIAVPVGVPYDFAGNRHWLLDGASPMSIIFGASGHEKLHRPSFVATGRSGLGVVDHHSPGVDGNFSSRRGGATIGQYDSGHFAVVRVDARGVKFKAHTNKAGNLIDLDWNGHGQDLTTTVGDQSATGTGRALVLRGSANAGHGLKLSATPSAARFSLFGTTSRGDTTTGATLQMSSRKGGLTSIQIPVVLPGQGERGVLSALRWSKLRKTLVYELIKGGGHSELALLQGSPAQARHLPRRYRRLLGHCARSGHHRRRYRVCRGSIRHH